MKEIALRGKYGTGNFASIDDEDWKLVSDRKWYMSYNGYVFTNGRASDGELYKKKILLHRFIMNPPSDMDIDHINKNKLDNRKENLRICTRQENIRYVGIKKEGTSKYKGVHYVKSKNRWETKITYNDKIIKLGYYKCEELAGLVYNYYAKLYFGEFANLNEIEHCEHCAVCKENPSKKYTGIAWNKKYKKWQVLIGKNKKRYIIGYFDNEDEAAEAYNKKAIEFFGDGARLNILNDEELTEINIILGNRVYFGKRNEFI